jgi:hypothetical protein
VFKEFFKTFNSEQKQMTNKQQVFIARKMFELMFGQTIWRKVPGTPYFLANSVANPTVSPMNTQVVEFKRDMCIIPDESTKDAMQEFMYRHELLEGSYVTYLYTPDGFQFNRYKVFSDTPERLSLPLTLSK